MKFAEVAVDAPTGYNRTFSFSIPTSLTVSPGHIVQVPFGSRKLQGVVFSIESYPQVEDTRDIIALVTEDVVLSDIHLELARWISQYYMCTLFEAVTPMLPPGSRVREKAFISMERDVAVGEHHNLSVLQRKVLEYVRRKRDVDQEHLVKLFGDSMRNTVKTLITKGLLTKTTHWTKPAARPRVIFHIRVVDRKSQEIKEWLSMGIARRPRQTALIQQLLETQDLVALPKLRKEHGYSTVKTLLDRGWIEKVSIVVDRDPLENRVFQPFGRTQLTADQKAISLDVRSSLIDSNRTDGTFLIQGVTGSGKTEVYLDSVKYCLESGKRAIILVPEISLTHQIIDRFISRFDKKSIAVLHSGLSIGQRFDQWWKIKQGSYDIVIGSRSAIFAPVDKLGLVIIDEEHEWTYKQQDSNPRYHTRDVASYLASTSRCVVLLGSASPDIGSYYRGLKKEFRLHILSQRVTSELHEPSRARTIKNVPLAGVTLVDMRQELVEGNRSIFSRYLRSSMIECLNADEQMILFLNRRGSSSYVQCANCGTGVKCRRCDVFLTYHKRLQLLLCHYCGYKKGLQSICLNCRSYQMNFYGLGTQTVVDEINNHFPDTSVLRWDRDSATNIKSHQEILEKFRSRKSQILVGTQMIAKGLHFPHVTLVGVISADQGLTIPDYRSGERVFQLLYQVSGRSGRGPRAGKVVIQTYQPENYAIKTATEQDYQKFYSKEMLYRREQGNPPYNKLIRLIYSHRNPTASYREVTRMTKMICEEKQIHGYSDIDILGPTQAYPPRLRGEYRWHIVLRGREPKLLITDVTFPRRWVIDVDPVSFS